LKTVSVFDAVRQKSLHFGAVGVALAFGACAEDVGQDPVVGPDQRVTAQFDPTNPIPVLTQVPTPTALVQDPTTGDLDLEAVAPEPCEGQTAAQCLAFAGSGGWPVNVLPTLLFEDFLEEATIADGIRLLRLTGDAMNPIESVPFTAMQSAVPAPPAACQAAFGYADSDIPFSVEVTLVPDGGLLEPGSRYFVLANRNLRAVPLDTDGDGTADTDPRPVEPSDLFFLLAVNGTDGSRDDSGVIEQLPIPVQQEEAGFQLVGPLLTQVEGSVRASLPDDATEEMIQAAIQETAASLFQLREFFVQTLAPLEQAGLVEDRNDLVFANTWSTQPASSVQPATVVFDPAAEPLPDVPIPMAPIFTEPTTDPADGSPDVVNDVQLDIPGTDLSAVLTGFNVLNGLSTLAPINFNVSAPLDPTTVEGNVVMYRYDPTTNQPLQPDGSPVPAGEDAAAVPIQVTADGTAVTIQPAGPLAEDAFYAVGFRGGGNGVLTADGRPHVASSAFSLIRSFTEPLVELSQTGTIADVNETARTAVECSIFSETGQFPPRSDPPDPQTDPVVAQLAGLELEVDRARFQNALEVFENLNTPVPRSELALAFPYKTQDINRLVGQVDGQLLDVYETLEPAEPDVVGPVVDLSGVDAQAAVCATLCTTGYFEIPVPNTDTIARQDCPNVQDPNVDPADVAELLGHPLCQANVSNITDLELYSVRQYDLLEGSPFGGAGTFTEAAIDPMQDGPRVNRMNVWLVSGRPPGTPVPATGQPVVMFQHGLTVSKETGLLFANTMAGASDGGWAVLLPDLPFHGERASDLVDNTTGQPCPNIDPDDVICAPNPDNTCMNGCDGLRDDSGTGFVSVNIYATRDTLRQTAIDHLTLLRHLGEDRFSGSIDIDPAALHFVGFSWGAVTGSKTLAFAEEIQAAVLNATGGGLTNVLLTSTPELTGALFAGLAQLGVCELVDPMNPGLGCQPSLLFDLFLLLAQTAVDPGDPLATAIGLDPAFVANDLLVQMIRPDGVIDNDTTFAQAAVYGFFDPTMGMPTTDRFQIFPLDFRSEDPNRCHGALLAFTNLAGPNPTTSFCGTDVVDAICNTYSIQEQAAVFLADGMVVNGQVPQTVQDIFGCN
jgi:pimeloyl-ACP methyl ester carboxylesterase